MSVQPGRPFPSADSQWLVVNIRQGETPPNGATSFVRMQIMPLRPEEFALDDGRFSRYCGAGMGVALKATLRIGPTPLGTTKGLYRQQWFAERTEWINDTLLGKWLIFIPSIYEDPDCRVDFLFENVREAVYFALRWKGEV